MYWILKFTSTVKNLERQIKDLALVIKDRNKQLEALRNDNLTYENHQQNIYQILKYSTGSISYKKVFKEYDCLISIQTDGSFTDINCFLPSLSKERVGYCYLQNIDKSTEILDLLVIKQLRGNKLGNLLLFTAIEFCKTKKVKYIIGKLGVTDKNHFNILESFYRKFGFTVNLTDYKSTGDISLELKSE